MPPWVLVTGSVQCYKQIRKGAEFGLKPETPSLSLSLFCATQVRERERNNHKIPNAENSTIRTAVLR